VAYTFVAVVAVALYGWVTGATHDAVRHWAVMTVLWAILYQVCAARADAAERRRPTVTVTRMDDE
jgi:hypothetical protein